MNGTCLQVPVKFQAQKWTVVSINIGSLFEQNKILSQSPKFSLRSFQICSSVLVKGIYTSDIQYTVKSLPKQMQFKLAQDQNWFSEYTWTSIPEIDLDHIPVNSSLKSKHSKNQKHVKFDSKEQQDIQPTQEVNDENDPQKKAQQQFEIEKKKAIKAQQDAKDELEVAQRAFINRTEQEIGKLSQDYNASLESKHIKPQTEVILFQTETFYDPNKSQRRNSEKFILKPDPIMTLDRIIGIIAKNQSLKVYFNKDEKLSSEILFTQANCIICYHAKLQKQRLLLEKTPNNIQHFVTTKGYAVTVSHQQTEIQKTGLHSIELIMTIWDLDSAVIIITVKPPLASLKNICISSDQTALSLSGKDTLQRELILVYSFLDLIKNNKIELLARQLSDFDLLSLKFVDNVTLLGCGKENIRIFKIKNNYLPSQLIALNNSARNKIFNNSEAGNKKIVYVTTECGLLYIVNLQTRQVDKILQLYDCSIQSIIISQKFILTASQQGSLKLWSLDFQKLISEVCLNQQISSVDINIQQSEICVLAKDGTLSVLDLDSSQFTVLMRSHQDQIIEICHNKLANALVSIGKDSSIKVWNCESLDQVHEFNSVSDDPPTRICSSLTDDTVAVGFKSGFLRVFNLIGLGDERGIKFETMIFEASVMDIKYSIKFMAVFYKNSKIVIFNIEGNEMKPVKNIDYEFPSSFFSLSFSPDGAYLANISSNSNIITVWETRNFGLKWYVDLTGETLSKLMFAPNGHDILVITTSARLIYLRVNPLMAEIETVREQYGVTDLEPTDFIVSPNNKFIICTGKDGNIKVFDYFMRGENIAAQQSFIGHLSYANKICMQDDMRYMYTVGPGNGIFRWSFSGDKAMPLDLTVLYEKTIAEIKREEQKEEKLVQLPTFIQDELKTYTEDQIAKLRHDIVNERKPYDHKKIEVPRPHKELLEDGGLSLHRRPIIEYMPAGYTFEQHEIVLRKILGCSIYPQVGDNIAWDQKNHNFVYTLQNKLVFEEFDEQKTQIMKQEFNDSIYAVQLSSDSRLILAYTRFGHLDGFPQCIVWDTKTRRKVSQITVDDKELKCVYFSNYSNMLLVVSYDGQHKTTIAVWDFMDGRKDWLAKSVVPFEVKDARWNPYINNTTDEFVTISKDMYHYWRITKTMQMQYQTGKMPQKFDGHITAVTFVEPMFEQNSVYMLIGLSTGYIWVLDTRSNSFLHSAKVLDCAIHKIQSSVSRIVVEGQEDTKIHAWELKKTIGDFDYDASDPDYFFAGKEQTLTLDGFPSASYYDTTAAEALFISSNNSIWLVNFIERITVKLKSCHEPSTTLKAIDFKYVSPNQFQPPQTQDQGYTFDQNYLIGSSGSDGIVKIWSMYDLEHVLNYIVPKEQCQAVAMHQFKPYMVCSFSDGYIRFFDIDTSKILGRCLINTNDEAKNHETTLDWVNSIKILPSGMHILCSTKYGQVFLIFVESWLPLSISIQSLVSLNIPLFSFDVSFLEPYNKWLVGGSHGKIVVYNRQDCNSFKQELFEKLNPPQFIFMDSFNVQEYVENCFTEAKRVNTLDHYYHMSQRTLVYNEVTIDNDTEACFLNNDLASYICYIRKCNSLFIRNFELHQVVKKIDLSSKIVTMQMAPGSSPYVHLILESNEILMLDFVNESNKTTILTFHEQVKSLKVCPNGRYLLTGGTKGDIAIWAVKRI